MRLPTPSARSRGIAVLVALGAAIFPAGADAARSWQPAEPPPAGFSFGGFGPAVSFDGQGNLSTTLKPTVPGPYQYGVRLHGGALGAAQAFPAPLGEAATTTRLTAQNEAGDLLMWPQAGNVVAFRPAPATSAFEPSQTLPVGLGGIRFAAMTPSGETIAQTQFGSESGASPNSKTFVIFRPSGPGATFDTANAIELPPALTDTATSPVGIAIDPDGGATAVYRSYPSLQLIQISAAPGGGAFTNPQQLTLTDNPAKWQDSAITRIATSFNGHAVLVWGTGRTKIASYHTKLWASRRSPGGTFGPRELIADLDPTHDENYNGPDYGSRGINGSTATPEIFPVALDSGATLVAFNDITEGDNCNEPGTEDFKNGSQLAVKDGGAWAVAPLGANGNVSYSQVNAIAGAGNSVALALSEGTRSAPCSGAGAFLVSARVGSGAILGPPVGLSNSGGPAGTGIAVNAAGDAAMVMGSPRVLRVYEDKGSTSTPTNPGTGTPGTPSQPHKEKPVTLLPKPVAPGGIKLTGPIVVDQRGRQQWGTFHIFCSTTAQVTCTITITNGNPNSKRPYARATSSAKKPALLETTTAKVAPGKKRDQKVYLTKAGKALLKQKGSFKTRAIVTVQSGGTKTVAIETVTLKRP